MVRNLKEKGKTYWFGKREGGNVYLYRNLKEDPEVVLAELREGKVPDLEDQPSEGSIPDLREVAIRFARKRIEDEFTRDQKLIKFLSLRIELDRIINLYYEKVVGFGIFFDKDPFSMDPCKLFREGSSESETSGMLAEVLQEGRKLCDLRSKLIDHTRSETRELLPNTSELAGEDIAAEILLRAGSLRRAGKFPSSTVQVLGAEKAFFKHATTGSPPPKHGLIFKFPGITALPKSKRGKASRMVAGKIAICLRADVAGRRMDTSSMREEVKKKMEIIRNQ